MSFLLLCVVAGAVEALLLTALIEGDVTRGLVGLVERLKR